MTTTSEPELTELAGLPDVVRRSIQEMDTAIEELRAVYEAPDVVTAREEAEKIAAARQSLLSVRGLPSPARPARAGRTSSSSSVARSPRGDRKGLFLRIIREHPEGVDLDAIVDAMNSNRAPEDTEVKKTYVYKLRDKALAEGLITRQGNTLFPRGDGQPSEERVAAIAASATKSS